MKKKLALFVTLACALSLLLGVALLGCTSSDDSPETATVQYTVTVTCDDASALAGIKVQLKKGSALAGEKALTDGKATFELEAGAYAVTLSGVPEAYTYEEANLATTTPSVTIALTAKNLPDADGKYTFTLTVQYPDGSPVADLFVQLCSTGDSGACNPATTDEKGVITLKLTPDTYEVHIDNPPEGYTFDNTQYTMDETTGSLTVILTQA